MGEAGKFNVPRGLSRIPQVQLRAIMFDCENYRQWCKILMASQLKSNPGLRHNGVTNAKFPLSLKQLHIGMDFQRQVDHLESIINQSINNSPRDFGCLPAIPRGWILGGGFPSY